MKKVNFRVKALVLVLVLLVSFAVSGCAFLPAGKEGKSAYDIARSHGFPGTEEEWLASLKGETGSDGQDGANGEDGKNLQGSAYDIARSHGFTGTEEEWLASLAGKDGTNGSNGKDAPALDIYDLFDAYSDAYPGATFEDFLNAFLAADSYDAEFAAAKGLSSVLQVGSRFQKRSGGPSSATTPYYAQGSGVVYRIEGGNAYVITNYHVVYDYESVTTDKIADEILVRAYGHTAAVAGVFLGGSVSKDIAVIKVTASELPEFVRAADIADSNDISLGMRAVAVGNPLANGLSVTSGIISVLSEEIEMDALDSATAKVSMRVFRTDTAINQGNSGGGMFNARGELIGIVNAKTISSGVEGMGYAIPSNVAVGIADNVIDNSSKKFVFNIFVTTVNPLTIYDPVTNKIQLTASVVVDSVTAGGAAVGYLQKGDVLLSVRLNSGDTFALTQIYQLSDYLYRVRLGDVIHLEVERGGETITVSVTAGASSFELM